MSNWISVKKGLPQLGRLVLLYDKCCVVFGCLSRYNSEEAIFNVESGRGGLTSRITHWQEMPEPPETYTTDGVIVYFNGIKMTPECIASLLNLAEDKIDELAG